MVDLGLGEGHEAPIVAPGVVEDGPTSVRTSASNIFMLAAAHLDPALPDPPRASSLACRSSRARSGRRSHRRRRPWPSRIRRPRPLVRNRVDRRAPSGPAVLSKPLDQQAHLLVNRETERTGHCASCPCARSQLSADREQGGEDRRIVLGGQAAEMAGARRRIARDGRDRFGPRSGRPHLTGRAAPGRSCTSTCSNSGFLPGVKASFDAPRSSERDVALVAGIEPLGELQ
jgi:hypothetical protein